MCHPLHMFKLLSYFARTAPYSTLFRRHLFVRPSLLRSINPTSPRFVSPDTFADSIKCHRLQIVNTLSFMANCLSCKLNTSSGHTVFIYSLFKMTKSWFAMQNSVTKAVLGNGHRPFSNLCYEE